jgi:hypothetical protein
VKISVGQRTLSANDQTAAENRARFDAARVPSWVALAVTLGLITVVGGCGGKQLSPEKLVQERCTKCHTLAPIEVARKTRQEWASTVHRMINRGTSLNDREAQEVIDYLSSAYGTENP